VAPSTATVPGDATAPTAEVRTGAEASADDGFTLLAGRRVGVVLNAASVVEGRNLLDVLVEAPGVDVVAAFAPEHGIRADGPAGVEIDSEVDEATGVPVHSLYGATRRPTAEMLAGIEVLVFDLQDVGARFYTYVSTMGGVMEVAAAHHIPLVVLDRPNPLGGAILDGFVLDPAFRSFIGEYPIPAVHGLTTGELALAIRGEGWLPGLEDLELEVVPVEGWQRAQRWSATGRVWTAPSPGLPTTTAVDVYPTTVLFEATVLSVGRGTDASFTVVGAPWLDAEALVADLTARRLPGVELRPTSFMPRPDSAVPDPEFAGETVVGVEVVVTDPEVFRPVATGVHLLEAVRSQALAAGQGDVIDRPEVLDLLAGTDRLRTGLEAGTPAADIVAGWTGELAAFEQIRQSYLLY
jgi:uncharacterized protein YbbC (DUF1343 family)